MIEIRKDIIGYDWYYKISNLWNIIGGGKKMKYTITPNYKQISLRKFGKNKRYYIHRLVAAAFIPNPNNKPRVNHKNWSKRYNVVDNLEWSTISENILHSYRVLWKIQAMKWKHYK